MLPNLHGYEDYIFLKNFAPKDPPVWTRTRDTFTLDPSYRPMPMSSGAHDENMLLILRFLRELWLILIAFFAGSRSS